MCVAREQAAPGSPAAIRAFACVIAFVFVLSRHGYAGETQAPGAAVPTKFPTVKSLRIEGAVTQSADALLREMSSRAGEAYRPELLDDDIRMLWDKGIFDDIWIESDYSEDRSSVDLTVHVLERPLLAAVEFRSPEKIEKDKLKSLIRSLPTSAYPTDASVANVRRRFYRHLADRDATTIRDYYREQCYYFARVTWHTEYIEGGSTEAHREAPGIHAFVAAQFASALPSVKLVFDIDRGPVSPVTSVRYWGNMVLSDSEIMKLNLLCRPRKGGKYGNVSREVLEHDATAIESLYALHGFLDAKARALPIDVEVIDPGTPGEKRRLKVGFDIEEGPQYVVRKITFSGNTPEVASNDEIRKEIEKEQSLQVPAPILIGVPYSDYAARLAARRLMYVYGTRGYAFCRVKARAKFDESGADIDVHFDIVEGPKVTVAGIRPRGNVKTQTSVLTREFELKRGDVFDMRKLDKTVRNLRNLGIFRRVTARHVLPVAEDEAEIVIDVTETETGMISMGIAATTNEGIVGQLLYEQRNYDWNRLPRSPGDWTNAFMGGGQLLRLQASIGAWQTIYSLMFREPYAFNLPITFGLDAYNRLQRAGRRYDEQRTGGRLSWGRRKDLSPYERRIVSATFAIERTDVKIDNMDRVRYAGSPILEAEGLWTVQGVSLAFGVDTRNSPIFPEEGFDFSVKNTLQFAEWGGEVDCDKVYVDFDWYRRLTPKDPLRLQTVFHLGLHARWALPYGELNESPIYERFYAGGIGTLRGFRYRTVGPTDMYDNSIGGDFILFGSAEIGFPLVENDIRGVIFYDAGNVWRKSQDFDPSDLKQSVGFGILLNTPLGPIPIGLYWAWILDQQPEDDSQRFSLNFAGFF